jgi:hypothetical protein
MHRHLVPKLVGAIVLVAALGGGAAYAFTAGNTVNTSFAGQGNGTVSGYTVYNISYGLTAIAANSPGDPQDQITSVSFQLSPDNATFAAVDIWSNSTLVGGGGGPFGGGNCAESGVIVTCQVSGANGYIPTPSNITSIDIQASQ